MKEQNEHFLADWLSGKITDAELQSMVSADDFAAYLKLRETLSVSQIADPDIESNFARTKQKLANGFKPRTRRVIPRFAYVAAAAACIIGFIALFNIFTFGPEIKTTSAQMTSVLSDDGTLIQLNSKSNLQRIRLFSLNRKVRLNGEAYFEVTKGSSFCVETPEGNVEVLGTKFNVISRDDYFEVICYEGHVKVQSGKFTADLKQGDAFRRYKMESEEFAVATDSPTWTGTESTFTKTPAEIVIERLESKFGCEISYPAELKSVRFTGSFTHTDLDTALKSVLNPLGMRYTIDGKSIRVHK